jgi:hypothetical protein
MREGPLPSTYAEIAAGPVIDGENEIKNGCAKDRQQQSVRRQDKERNAQDGEIDGELEIAGAQSETLLEENGEDVDAAQARSMTE